MAKSSISQFVGIQLPNELANILKGRSKTRGLSKSAYAVLLFKKWKEEGFPALDDVDAAAKLMYDKQVSDAKALAGNLTKEQKQAKRFRGVIFKESPNDDDLGKGFRIKRPA